MRRTMRSRFSVSLGAFAVACRWSLVGGTKFSVLKKSRRSLIGCQDQYPENGYVQNQTNPLRCLPHRPAFDASLEQLAWENSVPKTLGVCTESGSSSPTSTRCSTSAIVIFAAVAIIGLKFRA